MFASNTGSLRRKGGSTTQGPDGYRTGVHTDIAMYPSRVCTKHTGPILHDSNLSTFKHKQFNLFAKFEA